MSSEEMQTDDEMDWVVGKEEMDEESSTPDELSQESTSSWNQPSTSKDTSYQDGQIGFDPRPTGFEPRQARLEPRSKGIENNFHDYSDNVGDAISSNEQTNSHTQSEIRLQRRPDVVDIKQETDSCYQSSALTSQEADEDIAFTIKTEPPDEPDFVDVPLPVHSDFLSSEDHEHTNEKTPSRPASVLGRTNMSRSTTGDLSAGLDGYLSDHNSNDSFVDIPFSPGITLTGPGNVYYTIRNETTQKKAGSDNVTHSMHNGKAVQTLLNNMNFDLYSKKCMSCKVRKKLNKKTKVGTKNMATQTWPTREERQTAKETDNLYKANKDLAKQNSTLQEHLKHLKRKVNFMEKQSGSAMEEMYQKLESAGNMIKDLQEVIVRLLPKDMPYYSDCRVPRPAMLNPKIKAVQHIIKLMFIYGLIPRIPPAEMDIVPHDFFEVTFTAMEELVRRNRPNAVYKLATAICVKREDGAPMMDLERMPYALVEGNILAMLGYKQFGAHNYQEGYKKWMETQVAWFGYHWKYLYKGPGHRLQPGEDEGDELMTSSGHSDSANKEKPVEDGTDNARKENVKKVTVDWQYISDYSTSKKLNRSKDKVPCNKCEKDCNKGKRRHGKQDTPVLSASALMQSNSSVSDLQRIFDKVNAGASRQKDAVQTAVSTGSNDDSRVCGNVTSSTVSNIATSTVTVPATLGNISTSAVVRTTDTPKTLGNMPASPVVRTTTATISSGIMTVPAVVKTTGTSSTLGTMSTSTLMRTADAPTTHRDSAASAMVESTNAPSAQGNMPTTGMMRTENAPSMQSNVPMVRTTESLTTHGNMATSPMVKTTDAPTSHGNTATSAVVRTTDVPSIQDDKETSAMVRTTDLPSTQSNTEVSTMVRTTDAPTTHGNMATPSDGPKTFGCLSPSAVVRTTAPTTSGSMSSLPVVRPRTAPTLHGNTAALPIVRLTPAPTGNGNKARLPILRLISGPKVHGKKTTLPIVRLAPAPTTTPPVVRKVATPNVRDNNKEQHGQHVVKTYREELSILKQALQSGPDTGVQSRPEMMDISQSGSSLAAGAMNPMTGQGSNANAESNMDTQPEVTSSTETTDQNQTTKRGVGTLNIPSSTRSSLMEQKKAPETSSNNEVNATKQSDQIITASSISQPVSQLRSTMPGHSQMITAPSRPQQLSQPMTYPLRQLLQHPSSLQYPTSQFLQHQPPINLPYRNPSQVHLSQHMPMQLTSHLTNMMRPQWPGPPHVHPMIPHLSPYHNMMFPGGPGMLLPPESPLVNRPSKAPKKSKPASKKAKTSKTLPKTQEPKKIITVPMIQEPETIAPAINTQELETTIHAPCYHRQQEEFEKIQMFVEVVNKLVPKEDDDFWSNPPDFSSPDTFTSAGLRIESKYNALGPATNSCKKNRPMMSTLPNATVQVNLLKELHDMNPNGKWWLKVGSVEIENNYALRYNGKDGFVGDEDLGDGTKQQAEEVYRERKKLIHGLGIGKRTSATAVRTDVSKLITMLQEDNIFIREEIQRTDAKHGVYRYEVLGASKKAEHDDQVDMDVRWWNRMLTRNADFLDKLTKALQQGTKARLSALRTNLLDYNTILTSKKRTLARYLVVFIISDEMQNVKPYSWPIRINPVENITCEIVVILRQQLLEKMTELKMNIVGCVKDEWTSHLDICYPARPVIITQLMTEARQEADTFTVSEMSKYFTAIEWCKYKAVDICYPERPVIITQLMTEARQEADTFTVSEMSKYFTAIEWYSGKGEMQYVPQWRHDAVPEDDVIWLHKYIKENRVTEHEGLIALHRKLLPRVEQPHSWQKTVKQTIDDQYHAIMAIYLYRYKISSYVRQGVDFEHHAYVPAIDPITRQPMHVKETMQQIFKNVARDAKEDKNLTQEYKSRLSQLLDPWFKASVNKVWSVSKRQEANKAMLQLVLDDLMPGMDVNDRDYSQIDVNRPIDEATYMSEETLTSLLINLESDLQNKSRHPWASTCQDVSTFVSLVKHIGCRPRDHRHLTTPTLMMMLCTEFYKAIDPDLEFHYFWTDKPTQIHRMILNLDDLRIKTGVWTKKHPKFAKKRPLEDDKEESENEETEDLFEL